MNRIQNQLKPFPNLTHLYVTSFLSRVCFWSAGIWWQSLFMSLSSSGAIDRPRSRPAFKIYRLQDVTRVYLFSAEPAIAEVILPKCQPCWPLFQQPLKPPAVFETFVTCNWCSCWACCLCLVRHVRKPNLQPMEHLCNLLWQHIPKSLLHHNDPCGSVSQPLNPHPTPAASHSAANVGMCPFCTPTCTSNQVSVSAPLLCVCVCVCACSCACIT